MRSHSWLTLTAALLLSSVWGEAQAQTTHRPEYPRPDLSRNDWQSLNGRWEFEFDDGNRGLVERWFSGSKRFSRTIETPYCFQSKLSGIGDTAFHDVAWYRR